MDAARDAELREALAIVADYFPEGVKELARVCRAGNSQHNGAAQVLFWDRKKSAEHFTKGVRHWTRRGTRDDDDTRHVGKAAWRAMADLQIECERDGASIAPAALRAPMPHDLAAAMIRDGVVELANCIPDPATCSPPPNCDGNHSHDSYHGHESPVPPAVLERFDGKEDDEGEAIPNYPPFAMREA